MHSCGLEHAMSTRQLTTYEPWETVVAFTGGFIDGVTSHGVLQHSREIAIAQDLSHRIHRQQPVKQHPHRHYGQPENPVKRLEVFLRRSDHLLYPTDHLMLYKHLHFGFMMIRKLRSQISNLAFPLSATHSPCGSAHDLTVDSAAEQSHVVRCYLTCAQQT